MEIEEMMAQMENKINHPKHYNSGGVECIDVMTKVYGLEAVINFCECNAFKYLWRLNAKGEPEENMQKALWYIEMWMQLREEKRHNEVMARRGRGERVDV